MFWFCLGLWSLSGCGHCLLRSSDTFSALRQFVCPVGGPLPSLVFILLLSDHCPTVGPYPSFVSTPLLHLSRGMLYASVEPVFIDLPTSY